MSSSARPWLATYRENGIPVDINPDAYPSVVHMMEQAISTYGDKVAFHSLGQSLSYAEMDRQSSAFTAWLQHTLGVKKGDRIAVMLPNVLAFPIAFLGIARAGAVQVNVNPLYTPRELEHQLQDAGCKVIVIFSGSTPILAEAMARTGVQSVITVALGDGSGQTLPSPPVDSRLERTLPFSKALSEGTALTRQPVEIQGDDLIFLQYTGGTTGLSKGACLSHRNIIANTEQFKAVLPSASRPGEEIVVTAIPLYHIFALTLNFITYFSVGAENWLVVNPRDMDAFLKVLNQSKATVFVGVNTLYAGLLMHPRIGEVDFSQLRISVGGGAAVVGAVSSKWQALTGNFIREGYGLSETAPGVSFNPEFTQGFNGTTGLPLPGTDVRLLNDNGLDVATGESGEVGVKGPQVMSNYWEQREANAQAFTHDGYFKTGDIGIFDAKGNLKIVDRKKDIVIVSGFNVFPNEVEEVASACPDVAECACIGVPDEKTGEALKLFVVSMSGSKVTAEDVIAFCRRSLTAYKVPKAVVLVESLPKSTVGKILRRDLRKMA